MCPDATDPTDLPPANSPSPSDPAHPPRPPRGDALKAPQTPSLEAVEEHPREGDGPFGADMQHLKGGTRQGQAEADHAAGPYNTGSDARAGGSVTPADPRSTVEAEDGSGQPG